MSNIDAELMKFQLALTALTNRIPARAAELACKKVAMDVLSACVMATPVDTGRARGNWQASVGSTIDTEVDKSDKGGQSTATAGALEINQMSVPFGQTIFITNNVPYIERLEDGHSSQKPDGILVPALNHVRSTSLDVSGIDEI